MLIVRLKFFSACSANAKKYLAYTQRKLKITPFFKFSANDAECTLKGTWQRGGFSGVFAEIGSA
jgi:hypothetical protein